jgi:hypothetical protein
MTYGLAIDKKFIGGYHDKGRSYFDENGIWCKGCFDKLVTINQDIEVDQHVEIISKHSLKYATSAIPLLATTEENPKYEDDDGVHEIGRIRVPRTKESHNKRIITSVFFGNTEIHMKVFDETTTNTYDGYFDFLYVNHVKFVE